MFGGAVLLHDSALCFEAYTGGKDGLRDSIEWKDAFASIAARGTHSTTEQNQNEADFAAMRLLHASRAGELASSSWNDPDGEALYLIESVELRKHYGTLIGQIASSHHWSIEDVSSKLSVQLNAPASMPRDWRVDPIKIACLLRCADAAHLDSRRAPDFLRALANAHGISADHWKAQNWLERADRDTADPDHRSLIFTSGKSFTEADAQAWWVAFDAICLVDRELRSCADLLEKRPQAKESPPFAMKRVTGAASPEMAGKTIRADGWTPKAVEIHVSSLERLISQLGGKKLYGESQLPLIVLRELIQNARDAIAARRTLDNSYEGRIKITLSQDSDRHKICVEDDGVGMSYRVITGPLLDFGSSFWASDLARYEFPGLLANGYKPVGQFGVGFYSIFMIADSVTVSSRRFDKGIDDTTEVRFPNGLTLRPLIRIGSPLEFSYRESTRVSLVLRKEYGDPSSILVREGRKGYYPDVLLSIEQCLSFVCAGLDTRVDLVKSPCISETIHLPLAEIDTQQKRKNWLLSIVGGDGTGAGKEWQLEHAERLRPIFENGQICGLAALSTVQSVSNRIEIGRVRTVGGLGTVISLGDISSYIGCMEHIASTARRDAGTKPIASEHALEIWAKEQISLLPSRENNQLAWCIATYSLADLGCDPSEAFTTLIRLRDGLAWATLDSLLDIVSRAGLAIYRSNLIPHAETHHSLDSFDGIPTFWPIGNSALLSLERDDNGRANHTSVLSCIERRAAVRGIKIHEECIKEAAIGHFGKLDVIILRAS